MLDAKQLEWLLPTEPDVAGGAEVPGPEAPAWPKIPSGALWNHMASSAASTPADKLFIFGGPSAPREYEVLRSPHLSPLSPPPVTHP